MLGKFCYFETSRPTILWNRLSLLNQKEKTHTAMNLVRLSDQKKAWVHLTRSPLFFESIFIFVSSKDVCPEKKAIKFS